MYSLSCPYCGAKLKIDDELAQKAGKKGRCPSCKNIVHLIDEDWDGYRRMFPYLTWSPCADGRSSEEHVELKKHGIQGTAFFRVDDPVLEGWWIARRKGLAPCRCTTIGKQIRDAAKAGIIEAQEWLPRAKSFSDVGPYPEPPAWVEPPPFDPWAAGNDCMPLGGWPEDRRKRR